MYKCETFHLKNKCEKEVKIQKSNEMLVTTKLSKRKYCQVIRSKVKFKNISGKRNISGNAKRKKAASRLP